MKFHKYKCYGYYSTDGFFCFEIEDLNVFKEKVINKVLAAVLDKVDYIKFEEKFINLLSFFTSKQLYQARLFKNDKYTKGLEQYIRTNIKFHGLKSIDEWFKEREFTVE